MPVVLMSRHYSGDIVTFGDFDLSHALVGTDPSALHWVDLLEPKVA